MVVIYLNSKEYSTLPYKGTTIAWQRTKGEIDGLLYENGIDKIQWTQVGNDVTLLFAMDVELLGVERVLSFRFTPPRIFVEKRRREKGKGYVTKQEEVKNTAWRLFWWHLRAKLHAVKYGLVQVEEELASNIVYRIGEKEYTVGQAIQNLIAKDGLDKLGLPDLREVKEIDSEVVEG